MSVAAQTVRSDYHVADLSLADFGRKEIEIAEHEMQELREKFTGEGEEFRVTMEMMQWILQNKAAFEQVFLTGNESDH